MDDLKIHPYLGHIYLVMFGKERGIRDFRELQQWSREILFSTENHPHYRAWHNEGYKKMSMEILNRNSFKDVKPVR